MKTNTAITGEISRARLAPLIAYCAGRPGAKREVLAALNAKTGHPSTFTSICKWLAEDERKWTQPLHGIGVSLEQVWQDIQVKIENDELSVKLAAEKEAQ